MVASTGKASMLGPPSVPKHVNIMYFFLWYTSEQHTYTSSEYFHLEEEETILARRTKIFVAPSEHGFSFFQVKIFTGSVSVLLTSISLKIKKIFQFAKNVKCRRISWGWFLGDRTRKFVLMSGRNYMLLLYNTLNLYTLFFS